MSSRQKHVNDPIACVRVATQRNATRRSAAQRRIGEEEPEPLDTLRDPLDPRPVTTASWVRVVVVLLMMGALKLRPRVCFGFEEEEELRTRTHYAAAAGHGWEARVASLPSGGGWVVVMVMMVGGAACLPAGTHARWRCMHGVQAGVAANQLGTRCIRVH